MKTLIKFILPKNIFFDNFLIILNFLYKHKRLPTKKLLNDFWCKIVLSKNINSELNQLISDKIDVKEYIAKKVGQKYCVPTLAIINNINQLKLFKINSNFIIKPAHSSGRYIFGKKNIQQSDILECAKWLNHNFYYTRRERNYKFLKKRIIIEPRVFYPHIPNDYKFFCYKGKVKFIQLDYNRSTKHKRRFYNHEWQRLEFITYYSKEIIDTSDIKIQKPKLFNEMLDVAETISQEHEFLRVDMYTNDKIIYIGELTLSHGIGCEKFYPIQSELEASNLFFKTY